MTVWAYEIQVVGPLNDDVRLELLSEPQSVSVTKDSASTLLRGAVVEQSALVGVLDRLEDLGLHVREVRRLIDLADPTDARLPRQLPDRRSARGSAS
jgi:hypothetical protein